MVSVYAHRALYNNADCEQLAYAGIAKGDKDIVVYLGSDTVLAVHKDGGANTRLRGQLRAYGSAW